LDCIHLFRRQGGFERYGEKLEGPLWAMMCLLIEHVCAHWQEPDFGIWEVRDGLHHFVYSKVMCWVALDRGIKAAEQLHLEADLPRWWQVRDQIRADVLTHGYNTQIGAFTQSYESTVLDASNLLLPLVGFIAPDDPRMRSTVDRIMERLTDERGFVYRYHADDGLTGCEAPLLSVRSGWSTTSLCRDVLPRQDRSSSGCSVMPVSLGCFRRRLVPTGPKHWGTIRRRLHILR